MAIVEDAERDVKQDKEYSEIELEPSDWSYVIKSGLSVVPSRFASWIINFFRRLGKWFIKFLRSLKNLPSNPGPRFRRGYHKLRQEMDSLTWVQLIALLFAFTLFLILPLASVVIVSFSNLTYFQTVFRDISPFLFNPDGSIAGWNVRFTMLDTELDTMRIIGWNLGPFLNSIYVAIIVTILSVIMGTFLAFIIARYDFTGKKFVRTLLIFPILATPFIGAIGIKSFLGPYGTINNLFYTALGWWDHRIVLDGLTAVIFVQAFSFFSLVYLNAYSSFMGIDPSLEEQAENLGATGFKLFRSVTLPMAMPGIQAGAILTFILSIEDIGTPLIFGGQATKTLAYMVFDNVATGAGTTSGIGPAVGMILLTISLLGFYVIRKYSSLRSYASGTKGGQWNPRTRRIGIRTTIILYAVLILILFLALIPQISVILLSMTVSRQTDAIIPELTLSNYFGMAETYPDTFSSISLTLGYGVIATVIIVVLGASAAYIIARKDIPGKTALDMLVTSPIALPGIVIATGYFTLFYNTPLFPSGSPWFLIIMSYTVRKFPFTVRAAFAGLQSTPIDLEEASQNMGASKNKTFLKITLPLIGVSVLAGSLLSFVYSVSEVSTSLILGSVGPNQAPMTYWTQQLAVSQDGVGFAACLGVLMMALQMIVITITNKILGTRSSAITGI